MEAAPAGADALDVAKAMVKEVHPGYNIIVVSLEEKLVEWNSECKTLMAGEVLLRANKQLQTRFTLSEALILSEFVRVDEEEPARISRGGRARHSAPILRVRGRGVSALRRRRGRLDSARRRRLQESSRGRVRAHDQEGARRARRLRQARRVSD